MRSQSTAFFPGQAADFLFHLLPHPSRKLLGQWSYSALVHGRRKLYGAREYNFYGSVRMRYIRLGKANPAQPAVVFIHGFSDTKDNFLEAGRLLAAKRTVYIPDMPGFGESDKPHDVRYSVQQQAEWLNEFIAHLPENEIHLVGNSMGGGISLYWALEFGQAETAAPGQNTSASGLPAGSITGHIAGPKAGAPTRTKLRSLGLIGSGGIVLPEDEDQGVYHQLMGGENPFAVYRRRQFESIMRNVFHKPPPVPAAVRHHLFTRYRDNNDHHHRILLDMTEEFRNEDLPWEERTMNHRACEVQVPTALLWGRQDRLVPVSVADYLAGEIPRAEKIIYENTGHCPQVERPFTFARTYGDFLDAVDRSG